MDCRARALRQLDEFIERVPFYGRERNYDRSGHQDVSRLSHLLRYRVLTEEELVQRVLAQHPVEISEKFIQEILWRSYWKGWLELRPKVWAIYAEEVGQLLAEWSGTARYTAACEGKTELSFFNDWVRELITTGYLHNHTRMWFASVWIFTLRLPWQLGAALFFHHLLDADPASNTLSWRWVAGIHTPGKFYLARPENIEKYSEGRWRPKRSELAEDAKPVSGESSFAPTLLKAASNVPPCQGSLVLLHDDDLSADISDELGVKEVYYALFTGRKPHQSLKVHEHLSTTRQDAAARSGASLISTAEELAELATARGVSTIHAFFPFVGYDAAVLQQLADEIAERKISFVWHRRGWDEKLFPFARGGFFPFWQKARHLLGPPL